LDSRGGRDFLACSRLWDFPSKKQSEEELNRKIQVPWGNTPNTEITVETAFTHMVIEDMIH
jgi:hypothetical protein